MEEEDGKTLRATASNSNHVEEYNAKETSDVLSGKKIIIRKHPPENIVLQRSEDERKHMKDLIRNKKFYIGGNNGVLLVQTPLLDIGMKETCVKDMKYFIKWVECKKNIDYESFLPGEQIVNHIRRISCITTKSGLLITLREYERLLKISPSFKRVKPFVLSDFFMETYILKNQEERKEFTRIYKSGELWISKPSGRNQGKGIFLVDDISKLNLQQYEQHSGRKMKSETIIQRYISNPLLINGCKFDIRVYMLIASVNPLIVLYHQGYIRLACVPYTNDDLNLHIHLTNQFVQKKHPLYATKKEETIMNFDQFNNYVNEHVKDEKQLENDWVLNGCTKRMKEIMVICANACKNKLDKAHGTFDLLGFDFMIDDNMKVWLIEINVNPALHTNCAVLKLLLPPVVSETLDIVLEIFMKRKARKSLSALNSVNSFELLLN